MHFPPTARHPTEASYVGRYEYCEQEVVYTNLVPIKTSLPLTKSLLNSSCTRLSSETGPCCQRNDAEGKQRAKH